jgi:hypothetical protein
VRSTARCGPCRRGLRRPDQLRLVPQPRGFEGLVLAVEVVESGELAVAEGPHDSIAPLDGYTAPGTDRADANQRYDPFPGVDEALDMHLVPLPRRAKVREPVIDAGEPSIRVPRIRDVVIEDLGAVVHDRPIGLPRLGEVIERALDDRDVLSGHRAQYLGI